MFPNKPQGPITWISNRSWRFFVVVAVLAYPPSIGPAAFICRAVGDPDWLQSILSVVYLPLQVAVVYGPEPVEKLFLAYMGFWAKGFTSRFW